MALNYGKRWEAKFKQDWERSFPNTFLLRLHDLTTGYKITSQNPCDFIAFNNNQLWLLEVKSHEGKSIPFTAIPQYERLLTYKDMPGVNPYIIIWFRDEDVVWAVPIKEAEKMVSAGEKSIGLRMRGKYGVIEVPAIKKRVFLDADYTCLLKR